MNNRCFVVAVLLGLSFVSEAVADEAMLRVRALRAARKMTRTEAVPEVSAKVNTNFQGGWGGRYIYYARGSSCGTRLTSFDFRHVLVNRGASGYLSTNHDGDFTGRSRDRGRKWEFVKGISVGGRPAALAIVYQSLARNGSSASTGLGLSIAGGCLVSYGAKAIRLAR